MSKPALYLIASALIFLTGCHGAVATNSSVDGAYVWRQSASEIMAFRHTKPVFADLHIHQVGSIWYVRLFGGGNRNDRSGISADCEIRAIGTRGGEIIDAELIPVESDVDEPAVLGDDSELKGMSLKVTLKGARAQVTVNKPLPCPMRTVFEGDYIRVR